MEEVLFSPTDYRVTETASLATLAGFGVVKKRMKMMHFLLTMFDTLEVQKLWHIIRGYYCVT